jgi:hypothetical protein
MSKCTAIVTVSGRNRRCKINAKKGADKCHVHLKLHPVLYDEECSICMDGKTDLLLSCCKQYIHKKCLAQTRIVECPYCRQLPQNMPVEVRQQIERRIAERRNISEESTQYLHAYFRLLRLLRETRVQYPNISN